MKSLLEALSIYIDLTVEQDIVIERLGRALYEATAVLKQTINMDDEMNSELIKELENAQEDIKEYHRIRDREIGEP